MTHRVPSHREIIAWWPSCADFARATGVTADQARSMRTRNRIPPKYFENVESALKQAGFRQLSYAQLSAGLPRKTRRSNDGGRVRPDHQSA